MPTGEHGGEVPLPGVLVEDRGLQLPAVLDCEDARKDLSVLERLAVPGNRGPVMLGQVATLELTGGPVPEPEFEAAYGDLLTHYEAHIADRTVPYRKPLYPGRGLDEGFRHGIVV